MITYLPKNAGIRSLFEYLRFLFLHIAMQTLFFLFCFLFYNCRIRFFNLCDGCFAHRDTAVFVVSELYDDIIVCDVDDNSVETACRDDCIADCEVIQHCLQFFRSFFCGRIIKKYIIPNMMTSHIINIPVLMTPLFAVVVAKNIFFPPVIRRSLDTPIIIHNPYQMGKSFSDIFQKFHILFKTSAILLQVPFL